MRVLIFVLAVLGVQLGQADAQSVSRQTQADAIQEMQAATNWSQSLSAIRADQLALYQSIEELDALFMAWDAGDLSRADAAEEIDAFIARFRDRSRALRDAIDDLPPPPRFQLLMQIQPAYDEVYEAAADGIEHADTMLKQATRIYEALLDGDDYDAESIAVLMLDGTIAWLYEQGRLYEGVAETLDGSPRSADILASVQLYYALSAIVEIERDMIVGGDAFQQEDRLGRVDASSDSIRMLIFQGLGDLATQRDMLQNTPAETVEAIHIRDVGLSVLADYELTFENHASIADVLDEFVRSFPTSSDIDDQIEELVGVFDAVTIYEDRNLALYRERLTRMNP